MVFKPRKKRLSPDKVKANLAAQQVRLENPVPIVPKKVKEAATEALVGVAAEFCAKLQLAAQSAAEANPEYRPLAGKDWRETAAQIQEHTKEMPEAERKAVLHQLMQGANLSFEEVFSVVGLALVAGGGAALQDTIGSKR